MILGDWQRIEKVVHYTGFTINAFAMNVGLARAENLYQIKRGSNGISKQLAEQISRRYPEVSRAWLLTGEGEMIIGGERNKVLIPCYDADVLHIALARTLPTPSYMMQMPRLDDVEFAAMSLSAILAPDIPAGVMLFAQRIEPADMIWGDPCIVVRSSGAMLRYFRRSDTGQILLSTPSPQYDDIVIPPDDIVKLYRIKGWMKIN